MLDFVMKLNQFFFFGCIKLTTSKQMLTYLTFSKINTITNNKIFLFGYTRITHIIHTGTIQQF